MYPQVTRPSDLRSRPQIDPNGFQVTWETPEGWKLRPPKPKTLELVYDIPKAPGASGDTVLRVKQWSPQDGSAVEGLFYQWTTIYKGGGKDTRRSKRHSPDLYQMIVEIRMGKLAPKDSKEKSFLGVATTGKRGHFLFKMLGPAKTLDANKDALLKMIDSVGLNKKEPKAEPKPQKK